MLQPVKFANEITTTRGHCPFGTRIGKPFSRPIPSRLIAPKKRHRVLKCMGCISVIASFIMGQFNPQQRVSPANNPISPGGNVWSEVSSFILFIVHVGFGFVYLNRSVQESAASRGDLYTWPLLTEQQGCREQSCALYQGGSHPRCARLRFEYPLYSASSSYSWIAAVAPRCGHEHWRCDNARWGGGRSGLG